MDLSTRQGLVGFVPKSITKTKSSLMPKTLTGLRSNTAPSPGETMQLIPRLSMTRDLN
ncbi:NADPH:quinone reductase or related Zn-dependent oxidoreductase [Pseudomonas syringae pv. actinidiae]|uniref:NADPH:quinone reductase or related Zn-dependent oxidoreductase n=1 Tax=Pseudomonas syringae pv. actinidiae TaxID=103796 RepID=A0A2V0QMA8_PSESF|nr:NADPH:quinone reductase or related Zn-dependent oxidoreductase [Pseudomonas syringae pv. actinidiae]